MKKQPRDRARGKNANGITELFIRIARRGPVSLAIAGFLFLMKDLLGKGIFPPLTQQQGFVVILTVTVLTWSLAAAGFVVRMRSARSLQHGISDAPKKLRPVPAGAKKVAHGVVVEGPFLKKTGDV